MNELVITPEFEQALELFTSNAPEHQCIYLTGYAGTGKSTLVRHFVETQKKAGKVGVVLAPTGIAALNAGGVTIHSFFQFPFRPITPDRDSIFSRVQYDDMKRALIGKIDFIVIDEISMVRPDLLDAMDYMLRLVLGRIFDPFGGKKIIMVGDMYQLEPVYRKDDPVEASFFSGNGSIYPNHYFFSARAFDLRPLKMVSLTRIFRQAGDLEFTSVLNHLRLGPEVCDDRADMDFVMALRKLNSRVGAFDATAITLCSTNAAADRINEEGLAKLESDPKTYTASISGEFDTRQCPAPMQLTLKEGCRVMAVKNVGAKGFYNGKLGTVVGFDAEEGNSPIVLFDDGRTTTCVPETWESVAYELSEDGSVEEKATSSFTQVPLKVAYAVTIHKSQGLTFDKVNVDLGWGAFAHGQLYVAISRCRTLAGVTLKKAVNRKDSKVDMRVVQFFEQTPA